MNTFLGFIFHNQNHLPVFSTKWDSTDRCRLWLNNTEPLEEGRKGAVWRQHVTTGRDHSWHRQERRCKFIKASRGPGAPRPCEWSGHHSRRDPWLLSPQRTGTGGASGPVSSPGARPAARARLWCAESCGSVWGTRHSLGAVVSERLHEEDSCTLGPLQQPSLLTCPHFQGKTSVHVTA